MKSKEVERDDQTLKLEGSRIKTKASQLPAARDNPGRNEVLQTITWSTFRPGLQVS